MKKELLIIGLLAFVTLPACAELTTADTSSPEYLINGGYSAISSEMAQRSKGFVNGVPYTSAAEQQYQERPIWEKLMIRTHQYFDPADDQDTFMNHDIQISPSVNDL
ncbi:MAG: hypothetical protein LKG27_04050 [Clostridiaceae bacterium]|jgi:hypothetical protein|nr:hypothetical protein [Clostridiaceae bacterium]